MKFTNMTKEQLIEELNEAHHSITELKNQVALLKNSTDNLRMAEEKFRLHFTLTNDVMFTYDVNFKILSISANIERILGFTADELVGKHFYDLGILHPEDLNDALEDALSTLTGKVINYTILRFFTKDGKIVYGEVSRIPYKRDDKVVEIISVARDITDRIERENIIREGQETAKALLHASSDTSLLLDTTGKVIAINEPAAKRFGKNAKALMGSNIFAEIPSDASEHIRSYFKQVIARSQPVRITAEPSGRPISITMYPVKNAEGKVTRIAVNARSIPDGKKHSE